MSEKSRGHRLAVNITQFFTHIPMLHDCPRCVELQLEEVGEEEKEERGLNIAFLGSEPSEGF
jgi:hypothetical protein